MSIRRMLQLCVLLAVSACGGSPATQASTAPHTSVRLEPPKPDDAPLPNLSVAPQGTISEGSAPRLQSLSAVNQPVGAVVRELATKFGLQYNIDPGVQGLVNANLRNATLTEALTAVMPRGAMYEIRNGVLLVAPARVETKIFSLDYVALSRVGTASTVIQRRLGNSGIGGQGAQAGGAAGNSGMGNFGALGGGADVISAVSIADVWEEIRVAVEALVFDSASSQPMQQGAGLAAGGVSGMSGGGGRPFSRTGEGGRRLIINPIAGTITVSAFPQRLDQIETFIRTFEASIQRQVLIEAKIVEVNLDRSFEFGIDWNVVAKAGTAGVTAKSPVAPRTAGNVEFTLSGGPGSINVVLNALDTQGEVHVLSSPRVSALNNQRAVFDVTTGEIVFNVQRQPIVNASGNITGFNETVTPTQVNVGIVLDVLPQIGADNTVTMNIRPVVTSVARTATYTSPEGGTISAPVIDTRESDTMARLRAGETIIIGGLMQTRREKVKSGVPGLRSLPLLGRLFTRYTDIEKKAELVIFLTPTIIAGQPPASR